MKRNALEVCQKNELWALIKKVSEYYGWDDIEWLQEYSREILKSHSVEKAVLCFRDLAKQCL